MVIQQPGGSMVFLVINCVFIGAGMSAGVVIPFQLLPFVADVDELITRKKRAGTYAGAMTLIRKLIQGALVLPLLGLLLTLIGYQSAAAGSTVVQSETTLNWLRTIFILIPVFLAVLGIYISFRFPVTPETHRVLISEIKRLKDGGSKSDADEEVKKICEELTGIEYEKLY